MPIEMTRMRQEIDEIPVAVARLLAQSGDALTDAGEKLAALDPSVLVTIARGSSDHATLFLKYAIEQIAGIPVASLGPSLASIYGVTPRVKGAAALAISQSGKSPDIVALAKACRDGGALTIALTNTNPSPLTEASDLAIDLAAGPELSVAATKSFVSSIVAGLAIVAAWRGDKALAAAVAALPDHFAEAANLDWTGFSQVIGERPSVFVLGRGPSFAIACEAALKFKETCSLHAEAYSAAEVIHGPMAMVEAGFPVLALAARDAAEPSMVAAADNLAGKGASVSLSAAGSKSATALPFVATGHPVTDALLLISPFYRLVEAHARATGRNPDAPLHLNKVTETR